MGLIDGSDQVALFHGSDVALAVDKSGTPDRIIVGQETTFTIKIAVPTTATETVTRIDLVDTLPVTVLVRS